MARSSSRFRSRWRYPRQWHVKEQSSFDPRLASGQQRLRTIRQKSLIRARAQGRLLSSSEANVLEQQAPYRKIYENLEGEPEKQRRLMEVMRKRNIDIPEQWQIEQGIGPAAAAPATQRQPYSRFEPGYRLQPVGGGYYFDPKTRQTVHEDRFSPRTKAILQQRAEQPAGAVPGAPQLGQPSVPGQPETLLPQTKAEWLRQSLTIREEFNKAKRDRDTVKARKAANVLIENSPVWDIATPDQDDPVSLAAGQMLQSHPTAPGILRKMQALQEEMEKPGAASEDIYPDFQALERRYLSIADKLYGRAITRVGQQQAAEQRQAVAESKVEQKRLADEAKLEGRKQLQADIKTVQGMLDTLQDTDEEGKTISKDPERTKRLTAIRKQLEDRYEAMVMPEEAEPTEQGTPEVSPAGETQPISEIPATLPGIGEELNDLYGKANEVEQVFIVEMLDKNTPESEIIQALKPKTKKK